MNFQDRKSAAFMTAFALLAFAGVDIRAQAPVAQTAALAPAAEAVAKPTPTLAPSPMPLKVGGVTVTGSLRLRAESWDWYEASGAEHAYTFGAGTLRLALGQQKEKIEWQVEGAFPFFYGLPSNAVAPGAQGQLGLGATYYAANGRQDASAVLKQAFVRFKGVAGDTASSLKVGRFEFNDGAEVTPADATLAAVKRDHIAQRLIGTFGFTHVGRSFDGLHYARDAKAGNFTFVAARPTEGVFQLRSLYQLDVDFYYGAFTRGFKHKAGAGEARAFALHYHDGRRVTKSDNRPAAVRALDFEKIRITTVGGHYVAARKAGAGKADFLLWGAGQFGSWGQLDHRAGAIAAEVGYQFGGGLADKLKPWVRAGYFRSTGDGDAGDATHGTFFQMLPTPRLYARFPFYNLMNNEDAFAQLMLKPHKALAVRADVHHLRLTSRQDQWYLGGGAFQTQTFGFTARPSSGRQSLGWLGDVSVDYSATARTTFTFYVGGSADGGVQKAIYPQGNRARYAYLELTQKF
jgi:hypothetical protein